MYTEAGARTTSIDPANVDLKEVTWAAFMNKNDQSWNAFSNMKALIEKARLDGNMSSMTAYEGCELNGNGLTNGDDGYFTISVKYNTATYVDPETDDADDDAFTIPLDHQFARLSDRTVVSQMRNVETGKYENLKVSGYTLIYDLVDTVPPITYKAYDRDVSSYYGNDGVQSDVLVLNGTNSIKLNDKTIFINESTLLYSFDGDYLNDDWENGGFENLAYKGTYLYGEFDEFKASEPYFALVVCDPYKDYDVASRIVIISEMPDDTPVHNYNTTATGVYCGYTELDGKSYGFI